MSLKLKNNHKQYKLASGEIVPSVTTIINCIAKPYLIHWANVLGLAGKNSDEITQDSADIGTLTHKLIASFLTGEDVDTSIYTDEQIEKAKDITNRFINWFNTFGGNIKTLYSELPLVSEEYGFGGTIDWVLNMDGETIIADFKTTKQIYPEHILQVAGYSILYEENIGTVDACWVICLPKDGGMLSGWHHDFEDEREAFLKLLDAYKALKQCGAL